MREKMLRDKEQHLYEVQRSRALQDEKQRRSQALQYNDEDYQRDLTRGEKEYSIKRSRAKQEYKELMALKDAEREKLLGVGALVGKETSDRNYALKTIAKAWGLPDIADPETQELNRTLKQSQIGYYKARNTKDSNAVKRNKDILEEMNQASTQLERLKRMIRDGKERNELGEETGRVLTDAETAALNREYQSLFGHYSNLNQQLYGKQSVVDGYLDEAEQAINGGTVRWAFAPSKDNPLQNLALKPGVDVVSGLSSNALASQTGIPLPVLIALLQQFSAPVATLPVFDQR